MVFFDVLSYALLISILLFSTCVLYSKYNHSSRVSISRLIKFVVE